MIIRNFRSWISVLIVAACCAVSSTGAEPRAPQGVAPGVDKPLRIAPRPDNGRNSEGDFIQLKDGRLLLVYTKFIGTDDHAPAELVSRYSEDGGKTWSEEDVPVLSRKSDETNLMSVSLLRLQDGRIALFYAQKYASPPGSNYSQMDHILMRTSADEAATWSEPTYVVPQDQPGYRVLNNDRVIQLKSGRLVVPLAVHYLPGWPGWRNSAQILCYLSDDQGKTWRQSTSTLESKSLVQEPGVVELKNDDLLMFCRSDKCQQVSHSTDGGETWSALEQSDIAQPSASPASIERIPSTGDLLLVWNNGDDPLAAVEPIGRRPFTAAISKDEGITWQQVQNIGTDPQGWYCYTAIEFVGDHVLLGHCEYPRLNSLQITRFPVSWLYQSSEAAEPSEKELLTAAGKPTEGPLDVFLGQPFFDMQVVFEGGNDVREPYLAIAVDGTLLAVRNYQKQLRRSEDGGQPWSSCTMVESTTTPAATAGITTRVRLISYAQMKPCDARLGAAMAARLGRTCVSARCCRTVVDMAGAME